MRNYTTQMDAARRGIITPEMKAVAAKEYRTEEEIRDHYNNLKEKYGSDLYDEFGYLISPHKKYLIL